MSYEMIMKRASNLSDQDLGLRYKWDRTVFVGNLAYECKWPILKDFMKQNVGEVTFCDVFEENGKSSGTAAVEFKSPEDAKNACRVALKLLNRKLNIYVDEDGRRIRKAAQQCLVARVMAGRKEVVNHGDGFRRGHPLQSPVFHGGPAGLGSPVHSSGRANRLSPPFRSRHPDSGSVPDDMAISEGAQNKLFDLLHRLGIEANQLTSHVLVSNLDNRITKQKLFDVFSLSGQIIDITVMLSDRGMPATASIQFDRVVDAIQAIAMLDNQYLYDKRMVVKLNNQMLRPSSPPRLPAGLSGVGERLNIDELLSSRNIQSDSPRQGFAYDQVDESPSSRRKRPGNFQVDRNRMLSPRSNASSSQFASGNSNGPYNRFSRGNNDMISNSDADIYDDLRRRLSKNPKLSMGGPQQGRGLGSPQRRSLGVNSGRSVGFDGQMGRGFDDLHVMRSSYGGSEGKLRSSIFPPMRGSGNSRTGFCRVDECSHSRRKRPGINCKSVPYIFRQIELTQMSSSECKQLSTDNHHEDGEPSGVRDDIDDQEQQNAYIDESVVIDDGGHNESNKGDDYDVQHIEEEVSVQDEGGECSDDKNDNSSAARRQTPEPEQLRKLFVGGVNYRTEEETLRKYFSDFGEIVDCVIMRDPGGRSRGFAFVCYDKSLCVDQVMKNRPHVIDGRSLDVRRATPKEEAGKPGGQLSVRKLFIGGCREGITDDDLKDYFSKYGNVTDCVVMKDNDGKYRGFGFVTFDDYDPVDKVCLEKSHSINGLSLDVKKAMPKLKPMPQRSMGSMQSRNSYDGIGGYDPYDSFSSGMYGRQSYGNGGGAMRSSYGGPSGGGEGSYYNNSPIRSRRSGMGGWNDRMF